MDYDPLAAVIADTFRTARASGISIDKTAEILAEVMRKKLTEQSEQEGMAPPDVIQMQSIVGAATGEPFVQCRVGFEQWQWDIDTTRQHALALLQCAEAAVHDAAMVRWMTLGSLGMDRNAAYAAVADLRRFRGDTDRTDWR